MLSGRGTAGAGLRRMGVGCGEVDEAVVMVWRIVGRGISSWRIRREGGGVNEGLEGRNEEGWRGEFAPGLRRMRFSPVVDCGMWMLVMGPCSPNVYSKERRFIESTEASRVIERWRQEVRDMV